jgi:hypothetical protein
MSIIGTMPLINDYSLCQQMVSIYHHADGEVTRTVVYPAYLDSKKTEGVDRTGSSEANGFLLVIPCPGGAPPSVCVGDKVMPGEGPVVDAEDPAKFWRSLIPTKVPGLCVVRYVDIKHWAGKPVHVEAGG